MEWIGYAGALFIGISLGLIGGGGSILTVPVLVYLFNVEPVTATAYSLFIVGATSLAGVYPKYRAAQVNLRTAFFFGLPSLAAVFAARVWLLPAVPYQITSIGDFIITKPLLLLIVFAILMVIASISMIRNTRPAEALPTDLPAPDFLLMLAGLAEGTLTGMVGAGGGFLIIPVLVLLGKLSVRTAIGTSLLIIAVKSLIGFFVDPARHHVDWTILLTITGIAIVGVFTGNAIAQHVPARRLRQAFGWFVLAMGIYILLRELVFSN